MNKTQARIDTPIAMAAHHDASRSVSSSSSSHTPTPQIFDTFVTIHTGVTLPQLHALSANKTVVLQRYQDALTAAASELVSIRGEWRSTLIAAFASQPAPWHFRSSNSSPDVRSEVAAQAPRQWFSPERQASRSVRPCCFLAEAQRALIPF